MEAETTDKMITLKDIISLIDDLYNLTNRYELSPGSDPLLTYCDINMPEIENDTEQWDYSAKKLGAIIHLHNRVTSISDHLKGI